MKTLRVGDRLYEQTRWGRWYRIHIIERLTKTQAVANTGERFKIELSLRYNSTDEYYANHIGTSYNSTFYLETEKIKLEFEEEKLRRNCLKVINATTFEKLPIHVLTQIVKLIKEQDNE